jgi:splicing factor 3B subunit 3
LYFVVESDNNTLDSETVDMLKAQNQTNGNGIKDEDGDTDMNGETSATTQFGHPKAPYRWASCIEIVDPVNDKAVVSSMELRGNQCAISAALVTFSSRGEDLYLAIGVATNLVFDPKYQYTSGSVQIYKVSPDGRKLEFLHETIMEAAPTALLAFKGKLLVGFGRDLGLFDCGIKSILRKALRRDCTASQIVDLATQGGRIVVGDKEQSITYVVHKDMVHPQELIPFVDDTVPRYTTRIDMLDYNSTVGGDKFGNIWVLRCPQKVSEESDEPHNAIAREKGFLGGTPNRLELMANFYTNDIPVSVQKTSLIAGGEKIILWAGLQGTIGVLIPFLSRSAMKKLQKLELLMRVEDKPASGRDHLAYRSYYSPVKNVIDGDLIERFLLLPYDKKQALAASVPKSDLGDLEETIWNMRGLYAF